MTRGWHFRTAWDEKDRTETETASGSGMNKTLKHKCLLDVKFQSTCKWYIGEIFCSLRWLFMHESIALVYDEFLYVSRLAVKWTGKKAREREKW